MNRPITTINATARPVEAGRHHVRFSARRHPMAAPTPGIKGGQGRSGAELERGVTPLAIGLIAAAAVLASALVLAC